MFHKCQHSLFFTITFGSEVRPFSTNTFIEKLLIVKDMMILVSVYYFFIYGLHLPNSYTYIDIGTYPKHYSNGQMPLIT